MTPKPDACPGLQASFLTRNQVLFTATVALAFSLLYFVPRFPFHGGLCAVSFVSAVFHLLLYIVFPRVAQPMWKVAHIFNVLLLAFALHFSGGIMSPFTIFLIFIFISGAGYGIDYLPGILAAISAFLAVVAAEYFGLSPALDIAPKDVYANGLVTLLIVVTLVGHLSVAGSIYRLTVKKLRALLEEEHANKTAALKRLTELDAPSQLGFLSAKIAHDLRGPLGAIQGFLQLTQEQEPLSPQCRDDCDLILREIGRLERMIDSMVQYGRPSESQTVLLDPRETITNVISVINHHPKARRVRFKHSPEGEPLPVQGNREHLQQVYFNILKNSMEALADRSDGEVAVDLRREGREAVIVFRDNGPGIPKESLSRLTAESFSTKKGGSGMGLLISAEILRGHHGTLSIASEPGLGTTVVLRLPLKDEAR